MKTTTNAQDRTLRSLLRDVTDVDHTRLLSNGEMIVYRMNGPRILIARNGDWMQLEEARASC